MKALIIGAALALPSGAAAMLAPAAAPKPAADAGTVQKTLEAKILRQRLRELGLSDQEIRARMKKLSDQQIHQLASRA
jgi:Spy/CpxP family protein refolding chaperone